MIRIDSGYEPAINVNSSSELRPSGASGYGHESLKVNEEKMMLGGLIDVRQMKLHMILTESWDSKVKDYASL